MLGASLSAVGTSMVGSNADEKSIPKMSPAKGHSSLSVMTVDISGGICTSPSPAQSQLGTMMDSKKDGKRWSKSQVSQSWASSVDAMRVLGPSTSDETSLFGAVVVASQCACGGSNCTLATGKVLEPSASMLLVDWFSDSLEQTIPRFSQRLQGLSSPLQESGYGSLREARARSRRTAFQL